jgi:hypothetical protein
MSLTYFKLTSKYRPVYFEDSGWYFYESACGASVAQTVFNTFKIRNVKHRVVWMYIICIQLKTRELIEDAKEKE